MTDKIVRTADKLPKTVPPEAKIYQAEEAELSGDAKVDSKEDGYSGQGYVTGYNDNSTACTTFYITVSETGEYYISLRYAAGAAGHWNTDRTVGLAVNDSKVFHIKFKSFDAAWDNWSENIQKVKLQAGENTISYQCITEDDNSDCINLDRLSVWPHKSNSVIEEMTFAADNYTVSENNTVETKIFYVDSNGILVDDVTSVNYSSLDSGTAEVDEVTGKITGIKEGTTEIKAESKKYCATATIEVAPNPVISFDASAKERPVETIFGYILTPNYDVPDSRMLLLGSLINRETFPVQNFQAISDLDGSYYQFEDSIKQRCFEAYQRSKSVGYQWYWLLGMSPSWATASGGPIDSWENVSKKTPIQRTRFKQYAKDMLQYFKDHGAVPDFVDLTNEYWTGTEKIFQANWEAVREVYSEFIPVTGPGAVGFDGIPDFYIPYASENNFTIEGPAWHSFWIHDDYVRLSQLREWKNTIADYQAQYPETNGKYIVWEENNAGSKNPTDWTRSMANVIRTGVTQNIKGCLEPYNANGMSDLLTTNKTQANPAARRPIWWVYYMFGLMEGYFVDLNTDCSEEFTATVSVDDKSLKIVFAKNKCPGQVKIKIDNHPFEKSDLMIDLYKITDSENNGLAYQYSLDSFSCQQDKIYFTLEKIGADESWLVNIKQKTSPPSFFYQLTPDDGKVVIKKPTLKWSKTQGATSYTVKLSEHKNLSEPIVKKSGITKTKLSVEQPLQMGKKYYWSVTAENDYGTTTVTNQAVYSFLVGESAEVPGQFGSYLPSVNAPNQSVTPEFKWSTAYKADSYRLVVSENADLSDPVVNQAGINNLRDTGQFGKNSQGYYKLKEPLKYNTTYYWTVFAQNSKGERPMNGPQHYFTTQAEGKKPKEFKLIKPADQATDVSARTVLSWKKSKNAFFYKLEIAADEKMINSVLVRDRMIYHRYRLEPNLLQPDKKYYWRVTAYAKDLEYVTEAITGIRSFTTEAIPCSPLLYAAVPGDKNVKLWFRPSREASSYEIKYGSSSGQYTETISDVEESPYEITGLENQQKYYFAVVAVNENGESSIWNERVALPEDK